MKVIAPPTDARADVPVQPECGASPRGQLADSPPDTGRRGAGAIRRDLLEDGRLRLEVDEVIFPLIENWLPRISARAGRRGAPAATIRIRRGGEHEVAVPTGAPTLRVGSAAAWMSAIEETVTLVGGSRRVFGTVDLAGRSALLDGPSAGVGIADDLYSMLTIVAALLLGRLGRTPVHAGAVVRPDGGALLLAGDARAGKSTTCVNLIAAGWDYLSDDQVVLSRGSVASISGPGGGAEIMAEGWPRDFHLDEGWAEGVSTGNRETVDARRLGPGEWRRTAVVDGVLFPIVRAEQPTGLTQISAADALGRLLRQTPWLLVDPHCAPALLALLSEVVRRPAYELSLGLDTYSNPERLAGCIALY